MALAELFLGLLGERPAHGYDLKLRLDRRFEGSKPLPVAQVYATLARLSRDGLVEVAEITQDGGPERTVYVLTEAGRQSLASWLAESEPPGPYPAGELARKTIVALHLGADAAGFLRRQRAVHLGRMRELVQRRAQTQDPSARLAVDYAINHLDADLRWIEAAASTVVDPPPERAPGHPGGGDATTTRGRGSSRRPESSGPTSRGGSRG